MKPRMCHAERTSLCGMFSSLKRYFTLFEVSFILPTYGASELIRPFVQTPMLCVAQTWVGELLPVWVIKGIARPDSIAVSKFPSKEYKRKPNINKADIWKGIFNSNFHIENGNLDFV